MTDITFYMGLLKIFGRYINESILDDNEKEIFDEMIHRSDNAVETGNEKARRKELINAHINEIKELLKDE